MKSQMSKHFAVLTLAALLLSPVGAIADGAFEEPPLELNAALIVPDNLIVGESYRIDPLVVNDGYSNTYTLITDWGKVQAISDYRLRARIQEAEALLLLDSMSRAGVFGDALKAGVLSPFEGAVALIKAPIETTTGAIKGIGRWFGNVARSVTSSDPYQEGAISAAVGWAGTKRAFAVELGVDPYTDWEPLQQALTSVGRAAFAGGMAVGVAMGMATEGTQLEMPVMLLSTTNDMNHMLADNPPASLTKINKGKLEEMGIDNEIIEAFLRNYNYTPKEKLLLVDALDRMSGAEGRETFLTQAAAVPDEVVARYFQQSAVMMANYHTRVAETDVVEIFELAVQKTRDGRLISVFPIDYLSWSADASAIAVSVSEHVAQSDEIDAGEFWFEGSVSQRARDELEALGWTVKERVGLLTGEALQTTDLEPGTPSPVVRGGAAVIAN